MSSGKKSAVLRRHPARVKKSRDDKKKREGKAAAKHK